MFVKERIKGFCCFTLKPYHGATLSPSCHPRATAKRLTRGSDASAHVRSPCSCPASHEDDKKGRIGNVNRLCFSLNKLIRFADWGLNKSKS